MRSTVDERDTRGDAPILKSAHHEDVRANGDVASLQRHRRERGDMHQSMITRSAAGGSFSVRFDAESEPVDVRGLILGDGDVDALLRAPQDGSSRVKLRGSDERSETPGDLGESRVIGSRDARYDVDEDFFREGRDRRRRLLLLRPNFGRRHLSIDTRSIIQSAKAPIKP